VHNTTHCLPFVRGHGGCWAGLRKGPAVEQAGQSGVCDAHGGMGAQGK